MTYFTNHCDRRLECQRGWLRDLLTGLGYEWNLRERFDEDGTLLPVAGEIARAHGQPELWLIETVDPSNELGDPLNLPFVREQLPLRDDIRWTEDKTLFSCPRNM